MSTEELRASWKQFLETYAPLRAPLYRYCRSLTRSPWDAEDLVQDTLSRAFVMLAQMGEAPPNPQAWLFRVASNRWIDQVRRARGMDLEAPAVPEPDPRAVREAAGTLIAQLSPQERAAVVLKDAFDLSLEEIAEILMTTPGAIKAALHRGRERLVTPPAPGAVPARPAVLDAFCAAFASRDLDAVASLLVGHAVVEVVGATTRVGREEAKRTVLWGMMFGVEHLGGEGVLPVTPRLEAIPYRGEWVVLSWYAHADGTEAVRAVNRLEVSDDGAAVTRLQNYFFNPEFIADVCAELELPCRGSGYSYC